jgi:hypothetical protein
MAAVPKLRDRAGKLAALLSILFWMTTFCGAVHAQADRTIKIRMVDSKTGRTITTSEFQVWMNHTLGTTWVRPNGDGLGEIALPPEANVIAVRAQDAGSWFYMNCDDVKGRASGSGRWYPVLDILATGIAAPNRCNSRKVVANPGEFVFFVRPATFWEKMHE